MKVRIQSSKILKPSYDGNPPSTKEYTLLSVFDNVTFNMFESVICVYRPPTPSNEVLELGLQKVLSVYTEWAGRLGETSNGDPVIFLNDKGVKFVEALVDSRLHEVFSFEPSPEMVKLHPTVKGAEELFEVQVTRFTCGSLTLGIRMHHLVGDRHASSNFLIDWFKTCRGLKIDPLPLRDRTIFAPRDPPRFEFEHLGFEYMRKQSFKSSEGLSNDVVVHKVHFRLNIITKLKEMASSSHDGSRARYSTYEILTAHLWRAITKARGLSSSETTQVFIPVDGRMRMNPPVPNEYFGNLVLWAFPRAKVQNLLQNPLSYATKLIRDAISKVNDNYYKSFIDFANYKVKEEGLVPVARENASILWPNIMVVSWLQFPPNDFDFGGGSPDFVMPSNWPIEGLSYIVSSSTGEGTIDAFVALSEANMDYFKKICYSAVIPSQYGFL